MAPQGNGTGKTPIHLMELIRDAVNKTSQSAVARETGLTQSAVGRYYKGIGEPTTATLEKLGAYFGKSVAWLRGDVLSGDAHDYNENNHALSLAAGNFDTFNRETLNSGAEDIKYLFRDIALLVLTLPDGFYDPVLLERSKTAAKKLLEDFKKNSEGPANKSKSKK